MGMIVLAYNNNNNKWLKEKLSPVNAGLKGSGTYICLNNTSHTQERSPLGHLFSFLTFLRVAHAS